ncbi:aldehyde ferredoxin oxidoreductase C-terminal domain-containing protein [uncultured Desulfovibrio sp.]|uniref:aldehyde ferredoxin oxidoreductase C-terminal domain-containing protein n=1 Tax=uncultured Desulfovibrio sp. TaxID=167968 RepID=UPI0026231E26|nr:aldehyde ferredoxin oxidoreductase C-terminal domain-containing protein [uncultured Desulfovibrio sp.]
MDKIIRIDMATRTAREIALTGKNCYLGGRALTSGCIARETPPSCDPLGRHNTLIFAAGPFAGTPLSSGSRLSIGAKSPLTGGIKESNAGGVTALVMGRLGIRAVFLEGLPLPEQGWQVLHVSPSGVRFDPADDLCGLGVYEKAERLVQRYGSHVGMSLIGPAGEMRLLAAGIANADKDGEPSRFSGRGGLGAVMGSKKVHALVFEAGGKMPEYADKDAFDALYRTLVKPIRDNSAIYRKYGTAAAVDVTGDFGALPTRNFSRGSFEKAADINATALYRCIEERGGEGRHSHACMPGCIVQCSNVFADAQGKKVCSPVEYENIGMLGSNLGIASLDDIARLNRMCNDLGLDTIETGAALGVMMEQGVCAFGDAGAAAAILEQVRDGGPLGRIAASGAVVAGHIYGASRVPAARGQAFAAYDPRSMKGMGVTYATSSQGADHTSGSTLRAKTAQTSVTGQLEESCAAQEWSMIMDMLGICMFMPGNLPSRDVLAELAVARWGVPLTLDDLYGAARAALREENLFNDAAGVGAALRALPEFVLEERNPDSGQVFDIPQEGVDGLARSLREEGRSAAALFDFAPLA